jgi:hypothetical protein
MSRRKGTPKVRARKRTLFAGIPEYTYDEYVMIALAGVHRGAGAYKVTIRALRPWITLDPDEPLWFRTLGEADDAITNIIRNSHVIAALRALGIQ